jgi:preprotein translocase subunit SecE
MKIFSKIISYFQESKSELQKVTWPTRQETLRYSAIVIGAILIATAAVAAFDILLIKIVQFFVIK